MDMPLISVITAAYQKFEKIYETINSVLLQDYPRIEYIICDDGSDNFPEQEIMEFIDKNKKNNIVDVKLLHSSYNRGTVKNLNDAYKKSAGMYIFNLSAGDVFFSADVVTQILERFIETNCKVLVASRILYSGDYNPMYLLPHYGERKIIKKYDSSEKQYAAFVTGRYFDMASGSAMYFSREVMEEFNYFDENYVLWEDGPFLAKYLYKYKLEFSYDIISVWYETGGVSSGGSSINPLLKKDSLYFDTFERKAHFDELKKFDKRKITFMEQFIFDKSFGEKIKICLAFFPEVVFYRVMNFKRKPRAIIDKYHINKIINEKSKEGSLIGCKK